MGERLGDLHEVSLGDAVLMRGFKRIGVGPVVEAMVSFPAQKQRDRYSVFLYLGEVTRDELPTFKADDRLTEMGWAFVGDPRLKAAAVLDSTPPTETP